MGTQAPRGITDLLFGQYRRVVNFFFGAVIVSRHAGDLRFISPFISYKCTIRCNDQCATNDRQLSGVVLAMAMQIMIKWLSGDLATAGRRLNELL